MEEGATFSFVDIRLKRICGGRVLRLVATMRDAHVTDEDMRSFSAWFRNFYSHVDETNTRFCVIFAFDGVVHSTPPIAPLCALLTSEREVTRRLSVTTCIVVPPALSMLAQMAMQVYACDGLVHFPDDLAHAKDVCKTTARACLGGE